jgi:2'-5' RNA ligase
VRAFVALDLPEAARGVVEETVSRLRREGDGLSWVPPERWHVTLTFLGKVDDLTLSRLSSRLDRAARRTPPFELRLEGGGRFGHRVLWARVFDAQDRLKRLAERTTAAARREGLDVGDTSRRPHVTLARARRPADLRPLVMALGELSTPVGRVDEVLLVRSILGPLPRYETLGRFQLGSPAQIPKRS